MTTESRRQDQYIARFPDGMRDWLKERAGANNRSMNGELVFILREKMMVDEARAIWGNEAAAQLSEKMHAAGDEIAVTTPAAPINSGNGVS